MEKRRIILVPHRSKMSVRNLPPEQWANPPIKPEEHEKAAIIAQQIVNEYGKPSLICFPTPQRCLDTMKPMVEIHPDVPRLNIQSLAQADSGEELGDDHDLFPGGMLDSKGFTNFGPYQSTHEDWFYGWLASVRAIWERSCRLGDDEGVIVAYSSRPIVGSALYCDTHATRKGMPGEDELFEFVLSDRLFPFVEIELPYNGNFPRKPALH